MIISEYIALGFLILLICGLGQWLLDVQKEKEFKKRLKLYGWYDPEIKHEDIIP